MCWNEVDRVKYEVIRDGYLMDMWDVVFEFVCVLFVWCEVKGCEWMDLGMMGNVLCYMRG